MSVFRVNLNNFKQGNLDINSYNGVQSDPSIQRGVYVMGPLKKNRLLRDGDIFTDCNYWKQFAYPQASYENAFIEVVTDDGSFYSTDPAENKITVGGSYTLDTDYTDANTIDFITTYGTPATFLQVTNTDDTNSLVCQLNNTSVTFTLGAGETQSFNNNDLSTSLLKMKSSVGNPTASVIASVRIIPQS